MGVRCTNYNLDDQLMDKIDNWKGGENNNNANIFLKEMPRVIEELHRIAHNYMQRENPVHTLQATALVNEAYISLQAADIDIQNRVHFFALAANHMRRILVDHARAKLTHKRQAQAIAITADDEILVNAESISSLVLLDEVLTALTSIDLRAAEMYEMRLFSSLGNEEIAQVFNVSIRTVEREIKFAKAWVHNHLHDL